MDAEWVKILTIIGSNIFALLGCYGLSMKMWLHMDKKIDCIHDEMCDFHVKLEKLDADFKMKTFQLDLEFKKYLMDK